MKNDWFPGKIENWRDIIRFAFWVVLATIGFMAAVFAVRFSWHFFFHLWGWCERELFSSEW